MPSSALRILFRDELIGFARSRVMIVMWIVLPLLAILAYLVFPRIPGMGATTFVSLLVSNFAGLIGAVMIGVDIVTERNRKVYELFAIRPIPREAIIWAKVGAVFACLLLTCAITVGIGVALDALRGQPPARRELISALEALATSAGVVAVSTAFGALFGVLFRTVLIVVLLVIYVGQNAAVLPLLPIWLGLPDLLWALLAASFALSAAVIAIAAYLFRRAEM